MEDEYKPKVYVGNAEVVPDTDGDHKDELVLKEKGQYTEHHMYQKHGGMTYFGNEPVTMEYRGEAWERPSMIGDKPVVYDPKDHLRVVSIGGEAVTDAKGRAGELYYSNGKFTTER